jgi:ATPase
MKVAGEALYVPDFTAITQGAVSRLIEDGVISGRIIIHRALLYLLEYFASKNRVLGFAGLEELRRLRELHLKGVVVVEFSGERFRVLSEREEDSISEVNSVVREYALSTGATVITGDEVQYEICRSMGIQVLLAERRTSRVLEFEKFFGEDTMSVHLRENSIPVTKVGRPGSWKYVKLEGNILTREDLERIANEIIEEAKRRRDSFIEIDRGGSTIIQLGPYRVIIVRPPLGDGWEITITRPVKRLKLEDYNLPGELIKRLNERAEGILIAGAPGMGKTTFAQALAEYYMRMGKVVKTIESPRDMILPDEITSDKPGDPC